MKMFYKIGDVSKMVGVDAATLRYWEKEFELLKPSKTRTGQRIYSQQDLELIKTIKKLLYEDGFTVNGAKRRLGKRLPHVDAQPPKEDPELPGDRSLAARLSQARKIAREILEIINRQINAE